MMIELKLDRPWKQPKQFPTSIVRPSPWLSATYIAPLVVETSEKEELLKLIEQDEVLDVLMKSPLSEWF